MTPSGSCPSCPHMLTLGPLIARAYLQIIPPPPLNHRSPFSRAPLAIQLTPSSICPLSTSLLSPQVNINGH